MARYGVDISDEVCVELDVSPNAPVLTRVVLEWSIEAADFDQRSRELGGRDKFWRVEEYLYARYGLPLTRDGDEVGVAEVRLRSIRHEDREKVLGR